MNAIQTAQWELTETLLARLRKFWFPGGKDAARGVSSMRISEEGEMRSSPEARWISFSSNQVIQAGHSGFCWEAKLSSSRIVPVTVIDAYESGHGRLVVKAGLLPLKRIAGPEADKGELQRYLASVTFCPPILLNHASLRWTAVGPRTLQVHDAQDSTGASVEIDLDQDGSPQACRTERPRMVGKQSVLTPWLAMGKEFRVWEGLCVPYRSEAAWQLPEGPFAYYRSEVTSFAVNR
jgi:hypothetical protein